MSDVGTVRQRRMLWHARCRWPIASRPAPGPPPRSCSISSSGTSRELGLELYPAQEQAILELFSGNNVILATPTGSGKSLVALALHFFALSQGLRSYYTAPIKALVSEKFFALCRDFGADKVGLVTGDATVNRDAPIVCCTAEILVEHRAARGQGRAGRLRGHRRVPLLRRQGARRRVADPAARPRARAVPAHERDARPDRDLREGADEAHAAARRSPSAPAIARSRSTSSTARRPSTRRSRSFYARAGAPVYIVNFTQRGAAETAQNLMSIDLVPKERKRAIAEAIDQVGVRFDSPVRQGGEALSRARHRPAPRGAPAEVPAARREARAEGAPRDRQRHRHARRRREHPDPHGALHPALQVRRREDRDPERPRLPADRGTRRAKGLRRPGLRRRAGARARDREPAPGAEGRRRQAKTQDASSGRSRRTGGTCTGTARRSTASSRRSPSRSPRASASRTG